MSSSPPPMPHEAHASRFSGRFLFKDKVNQFFPTAVKPIQGRILPGFDWTVSPSDPAFATSWEPYRSSGDGAMRDPKTNLPAFTRWFLEIDVFDGLGSEQRDTVIANSSRSYMLFADQATASDKQDAFADVYNLVRNKAKSDKRYERYIKTEKKNERPLVPRMSSKVLTNDMAVKDSAWQVGVRQTSYAGLKHMKGLLDMFPNPMEPMRDSLWKFLYGDVTHPMTGLLYTTVQIQEDKDLPFNSLQFSKMKNTTTDVQVVPAPASILAQRVNFWNPAIYAWMTYQEQVDYMIQETQVPEEFIIEACSHRANVTPRNRGIPQGLPAGMPQGLPQAPMSGVPQGFPQAQGMPQLPGLPQSSAQAPLPALPSQFSTPPAGQDYIPGIPGDPNYVPNMPPAPTWPPAGWQQHPANASFYFKDQEVLKEEELRARFAPPPPPVVPAIPSLPPQNAVPGLPFMPSQLPAVATAVPGLPPIIAQSPAAPVVPVIPEAPPPAPPAPVWPPDGWTQHPASPSFYFKGQEVLSEVDLKAKYAPQPVIPPAPVQTGQPPLPQIPSQPAAPQSFGPSAANTFPPEVIRTKLGAEADEFMSLDSRSHDTSGNGLTSADMDRWMQLWTRLAS